MNKNGQVYVLQAGETDFFKIGLTRSGSLDGRIRSLQLGCPYDLRALRTIQSSYVTWLEKRIHAYLEHYRVPNRNEWFEITKRGLLYFLDNTVPGLLEAEKDQLALTRFSFVLSAGRCSCGSFRLFVSEHDGEQGTLMCRQCSLTSQVHFHSVRRH